MTTSERKQELLAIVLAQVAARIPAPHTATAAAFVAAFYDRVDPDDLVERAVDDLYGAALSHWHFAQERRPGAPRIRVYNPTVPEHGWQSRHTIVEMVNDDMPFLVDSVTTEVNRQGLTLHLIVHPVIRVTRDALGTLQALNPDHAAPDGQPESFIQAEIDRRSSPEALAALHDGLVRVLGDVRAAVDDWPAMLARLRDCIAETEARPGLQDEARSTEARAFLHWVAGGNFTLLGYRSYDLVREHAEDLLRVVANSGLGILRGGAPVSGSFANLSPAVRARARDPQLLIIAKSNARATVHRPGYLDYLGIKRFNDTGDVIGEHRFLGLFTSSAYNTNPRNIPLLRHKLQHVMEKSGVLPGSHAAKALQTILEQYPRDELIQIDADELLAIATGILHLGERQRTRLFIRRDAYHRFFACLVFVPRDRYDTETRQRMQAILMQAFDGASCEYAVQLSESVLARVLFVIRVTPGALPQFEARDLERRIAEVASRWEDALAHALDEHCGEEAAKQLLDRYRHGFPAAYREAVSARSAVYDIDLMEAAEHGEGITVSLYAPLECAETELRVKILQTGQPLALSDSMPMLEHLGVRVIDEHPFRITRRDGAPVWIHDFGLTHPSARRLPVDTLRTLFHEAFLQIWRGEVENDHFNQLILSAGLDWRQVKILRAYAKYMRQIGVAFSPRYIENTLIAHGPIATRLVRLFEARFNPAQADRDAVADALAREIAAALEQVANLDEDRILRQFLALIQATLRTNFWRRDGKPDPKPYVSFKFDPGRIPGLPAPRPKFEIFVFSPRVEGVHLRGGDIARGGLRWSDRMEDFRTEVLGLVKAQIVKNAVIVPTGSKGGFVVKRPPAGGDREALLKEGIACYETYLQGLLDITDNLVGGQVVPPPDVVRHDGDDPYLVVAADKGTATFSDTANAVARRYGFWLDDAFASGGSAGYDHKKMGITARGAWESVKRHFAELGHDTQTQDFTVAGIGDLSGDVFGNGMLLSRHIRLVAAFDHRHIFLDPTPDAATSFAERQRLFALPRSSWDDYHKDDISAGGGVWPRSAKAIPVSPEVRAALAIDAETLTPAELISAILKAPVDLLYNGGIGTYVKATAETHAQVGDRANDAIRVNAADLRCKVVGEGGNLGLTQRGRIEYARAGGGIYTDAIDNSAGVDCSDHEVNIKILLGAVVADGELTGKQRDKLLAEMTDEVATLVLTDNVRQTQILSVMAAAGPALFDEQVRYMRQLEKSGRLNRALECLPDDDDDDAVAERRTAGLGLTLPELAVLLAYSKIDAYDRVIASDAPDQPVIARQLTDYFPTPLRQRFPAAIAAHPLRRQIIATAAINEMLNRLGCTFAFRLATETGADAGAVLRAFTVTRDAFNLPALWAGIESLPPTVPAPTRNALFLDIIRLADRAAQWLLRRPTTLADLDTSIARLAATLTAVSDTLEAVLGDGERQAFTAVVERYTAAGVPPELARRVVALVPLFSALDIDEIVTQTGQAAGPVAAAYFDLVSRLELLWLNQQIAALPAESHWQGLARDALRDDLAGIAATLTAWVFEPCQGNGAGNPRALIDAWEAARATSLKRYAQVIAELRPAAPLDMPMLSVALRELKTLAKA